jgi:hypothetical protein
MLMATFGQAVLGLRTCMSDKQCLLTGGGKFNEVLATR